MLKNEMIVVVDTREQKNQHILDYFEENNIQYICEKLDSGDYSFDIVGYPELSRKYCIEKKNGIDEICNNFTKKREQFKNEFDRAKENNVTMDIVIENTTWKKIYGGKYRSNMLPQALSASIFAFARKYKMNFWFVDKSESPRLIYDLLQSEYKKAIKTGVI